MSMNKTLILALTFIFLQGCKSSTTTVTSPMGSTASTSCVIGKWPDSRLPLTLKMSSEFTGDYNASHLVGGLNPLEQMAKAWNDPVTASKTLVTVPFAATSTSGYSSTSSFRDSEIGIYKSHTWFSGVSSSALAITQFFGVITSNGGLGQYIELSHADIIMNYRDYGSRFTMTNNPAFEFDVPTVVLHEMGHLLGLCHETKKTSIMAPYYLTTQRSLKAYDSDIIKDIYVDNAITSLMLENSNANALSSPVGTEVKGIIELRENGECKHYLNGVEHYSHKVDLKQELNRFKRKPASIFNH